MESNALTPPRWSRRLRRRRTLSSSCSYSSRRRRAQHPLCIADRRSTRLASTAGSRACVDRRHQTLGRPSAHNGTSRTMPVGFHRTN